MQYMIRSSAGINFSVYMIYTQDDRERWMGYIQRAVAPFSLPANVCVTHLWDPDMTSGFVTKYGVVSTPKLFLLDRNGVIIGRDLTPTALGQVVEVQESQLNPTEMIFEQIFSPLANTADTTLITKEIDTFSRTPRITRSSFMNCSIHCISILRRIQVILSSREPLIWPTNISPVCPRCGRR